MHQQEFAMMSHCSLTPPLRADEVEPRIPLVHQVLQLPDGHRVGISVGGQGIPLVFLHGLALNRRAYLEMLSGFAGLGFRVIAIDAAGHGETADFPAGKGQLADFVGLTLSVLDALGIERAVFAGHSMGGRIAIELSASAPERVLAAVLINAAAGASFDRLLAAVSGPAPRAAHAIRTMLQGTGQDLARLSVIRGGRYVRVLGGAVIGNLRRPLGSARAALAMLQSPDSTPQLRAMRKYGIPTLVLHGDNDFMVPFETAYDIAEDAGGSLYRLPGACHSWMIADPRQGVDALRQLIDGELGDVLRFAAKVLEISDQRDLQPAI
jgi:pimeloyl-ACP methyl ester carboxylesterase